MQVLPDTTAKRGGLPSVHRPDGTGLLNTAYSTMSRTYLKIV